MLNENLNYRFLAAACIALIGVGAVVWSGYRQFGGHPTRATAASSLPELPPEYRDGPTLIPSTDEIALGAIELETVRAALKRTVESKGDVFANVGAEAQRKFADAAWLAMAPVLSGSFEEYLESARLLGADPEALAGSGDAEAQDARRKGWERFMSHNPVVGLRDDGVVLGSFCERGRKRSMFQDGLLMIRSGYGSIATTQAANLYPGVDNFVSKKLDAVEIRCLTEVEIDGKRFDAVMAVALAWDPIGRRWQPIERRVYGVDEVPYVFAPPL